MNKPRAIAFILALVTAHAAGSAIAAPDPQCQAAAAAAAAYALIEQGKLREGCDRFLAEVQRGSGDAWAYRGAALCAAQDSEAERLAAPLRAALTSQRVRPEMAALGRGFLAWFGNDYEAAERELRLAVERAPHLALASNALGAVIKARGDAARAIPSIKQALRHCPGLEMARRNLRDAELRGQVFERLLKHLEAWPKRWNQLPAPMVKPSGKTIETVLNDAGEAEVKAALGLISRLAQTAPGERRKVLDAERKARALSEVDLWVPFLLAENEKVKSVEEAALTIDAWFDLAGYMGRKDGLLAAASASMELVPFRMSIQRVLPATNPWANLPSAAHERWGAAMVGLRHARLLFQAGHNRRAVTAYRAARGHFVAVGSQLGQGNTFDGEAEVLFRLGDNEGALKAYRAARGHFVAVGSRADRAIPFSARPMFCFDWETTRER